MPTSTSARRPRRPSWAGIPADDRRAARRRQLVAAAFDLLGTEGWSGTTVRAVCQTARLNPRYFYESFDSLDALLVAVYDDVVGQLAEAVRVAQAAAPPDVPSQVRATIDCIVRFVDEDRRRARVLYVEALGNEALNRRRIDTGHALVEFVERDAVARHGRLPRGEQIGRVGAAILVGGFAELLVAWLDGRVKTSRARLVDDATALFVALGDAAAGIAASRAENAQRSGRPSGRFGASMPPSTSSTFPVT